jgi:hypothetical protein
VLPTNEDLAPLSFGLDNRTVAFTTNDGAVQLQDVLSGAYKRIIGDSSCQFTAARLFSKAGMVATTCASRGIELWDVSSLARKPVDFMELGTDPLIASDPSEEYLLFVSDMDEIKLASQLEAIKAERARDENRITLLKEEREKDTDGASSRSWLGEAEYIRYKVDRDRDREGEISRAMTLMQRRTSTALKMVRFGIPGPDPKYRLWPEIWVLIAQSRCIEMEMLSCGSFAKEL